MLFTSFALGTAGAQEMFSVNLWTWGKPSNSVWTDGGTLDITMPGYDPDLDTLFLGPSEVAGVPGVSETDGWENIEIRGLGSANINNGSGGNLANGITNITGSEGSIGTFQVLEKRNESTHDWNSVRDTNLDVNTGNATILDSKIVGNEQSGAGAGDPDTPSVNGIYEWTVPFAEYDLIIYLSMNRGQFGDGMGYIESPQLNGGVRLDWDIPSSASPDGALDEVEFSGDMGNYVVFEGLTASTITATINGYNFNHGGPSAFQIIEVGGGGPTFIPGDFNGDNVVDGADYALYADSIGLDGDTVFADGSNVGGTVTMADYDLWRSNFGNTNPPLVGGGEGAVPEPGTIALLAGGLGLGLIALRKNRK